MLVTCSLRIGFAQQSATLSGIVTDQHGAVIVGTVIRLTNTHSGEMYMGVTNQAGYFVVPLIKPGDYELAAESPGFKLLKQAGIHLETGVAARTDITLYAGQLTEVVTVDESASVLETESSSVNSVIRNRAIVGLPLSNRRAAQLGRLSGFTVQNGIGSNFAFAGGRGDFANYTIDGGNAQNVLIGIGVLMFDPPLDSLQEFRVEISNYKAELGRTGGGILQFTTRSGTNNFHGSVYEFLRNDILDARTFFASAKPILRYNQFGFSVGGPIRRDQTHFFFNYEGSRMRRGNVVILSVPSPAEMNGDFSALGRPVRDPRTGSPFPGNVIPRDRMDPVGAALAAYYPQPNVPGAQSRANNYRVNQPITNDNDVTVTRIDHVFGRHDRIYGRLLTINTRNENGQIYPTPGTDYSNSSDERNYVSASATWIHHFGQRTMVETRYTWEYRKFHNRSGGIDGGIPEQIGLKGTNPRYFPRINLSGLPAFGTTEHERLQFPIIGHHVVGSLTHLRGNHTLKFGLEYRHSRNEDQPRGNAGGVFNFDSVGTGDSLASLLLGHVSSASRSEVLKLRSHAATIGAYAQTDWKITQRLTLNLGLRWDLDVPRYESLDSRQNSFDPSALNPVCQCPGLITWSGRGGMNKYAHNFDKNNFGPRIGFAYRIGESWVLRGGAGIVYVGVYDIASPVRVNIGFSSTIDVTSPDGGRTPAILFQEGLPPVRTPSESDLVPGFGSVPIGQPPTLAVEYFEPNKRATPYLETFSLNIQRLLPWNTVIELGYVGTLGHKLTPGQDFDSINQVPPDLIRPGNVQALRPFPQFSDVRVLAHTVGNSSYHAANIRVEKRLSAGLQFTANYTWSKFLDDVESRGEIGGNEGNNAFSNQYDRRADKALSGNHVEHRFIIGSVWEMPIGRGKLVLLNNPWLNAILGDWSTGLIMEVRSGSPFGVIESNPAAIYPTALTVRSNITGPYLRNPRWRNNVLGEPYFDITAISAPSFGHFGNTARTFAIGPGAFMADLSILKDISIREQYQVQFRIEMLNFPNHPNFSVPNQQRGTATFGRINNLINGNQARIIQLGLRFNF